MAVEARITGGTGTYVGASTNIVDYSTTEDATPIDPNNSSGGVGQLTFSAIENRASVGGTLDLMDNAITLIDSGNGTTSGVVTGLDASAGIVSVTANSRLNALLATATALPVFNTVEATFRYYLSLANITDRIMFTPGTYYRSTTELIAFPGWTDIIWDRLRMFATAMGAEIALVNDFVTWRPLRQRIVSHDYDSDRSFSVAKASTAQSVDITYYSNTYRPSGLVYPDGGWTPDTEIYSVDLSSYMEVNIPITASLLSVEQPKVTVNVNQQSLAGVYTVIDNNGKLVNPTTWTKNGGQLTVTINPDGESIDLFIRGMDVGNAPFRIAMPSSKGASKANMDDSYSSLRIRGNGVFRTPTVLTVPTGVSAAETPTVTGATIENPFVSNPMQAHTLGMIAASAFAGYNSSISTSATSVSKRNQSGDFIAQSFGNVAGARVKYRDAFYRVDSGGVSATGVSYSASLDTTFNDFKATWLLTANEQIGTNPRGTQYTFSDFATMYAGRTFGDFSLTPLWRTYAGYGAATPGANPIPGTNPSTSTLPSDTLLPSNTLLVG